MEFWSTVTFRAGDENERAALQELMGAVKDVDARVVEAVFRDGAVVAEPQYARALAEALQQLVLDEDSHDRLRRGLVKALAFNQHYICNSHGWEPAAVAQRHKH